MARLALLFVLALLPIPAAPEPGVAAVPAPQELAAGPRELAALLRRASRATEATTIRLAPGRYPDIRLSQVTGPLRLIAADPADPPRIGGLVVQESAGLSFEGLIFEFVYGPPGTPVWTAPFRVSGSRDVSFDRVLFEGDLAQGLDPAQDGFPAGRALLISDSSDLRITGSEFRKFYIGVTATRSARLVFEGNALHGMRKDGMNLSQVTDIRIENNSFTEFTRSLASGDHADMIQFWTTNTVAPSSGVTIRGNVFNSGHGHYTQSIFMRNELVDQGKAGDEMRYRDILIEQNVIVNGHLHGISVGESDGLVIRNNTLIRNRLSEPAGASDTLASPRISVAAGSRNVTITRNAARSFPVAAGADWTVEDNLVIQDMARLQPGFYGTVFRNALAGDPRDLASFRALPDGALSRRGIGAARLDPDLP